jgi:hypothetical protein
MFEVILSPEAQDFFAAADKPLARKLGRCFTAGTRTENGARKGRGRI